jgi:hypothetical protein
LQRLEWATRFRPVHIQTLLLSGIPSQRDEGYLYSSESLIAGEAGNILRATQVSIEGKSKEAILTEFQKLGLMLTHVLECPLNEGACVSEAHLLIRGHLSAALARIRRSLKPKRILLVSAHLRPLAQELHSSDLGCPVFPETEGTFLASPVPEEPEFRSFRMALAGAYA